MNMKQIRAEVVWSGADYVYANNYNWCVVSHQSLKNPPEIQATQLINVAAVVLTLVMPASFAFHGVFLFTYRHACISI